jgi:histidinol-phosphate/aromatic aminotransferase/cobyric acid decarboxylase-like protein/choline kinase
MGLQGVILAAGVGRRMRPLSDACHKALLPIAGTTVLERIMDALETIDASSVTVVTGYRAEEIEEFLCSRYAGVDLRFVHNPRYEETNNIVSLAAAMDELTPDDDVVLIECDLLFDPSLLTRLVENPGRNVALVDHYRTGMDGTVVSIRDGYIKRVFPVEVQDADFSYDGKFKTLNIYRFDRDFCRSTLAPLLRAYATEVDPSCYYEQVLGMLSNIPAHRISAEVVAGERWFEIDDPNDLAGATFRFEPERRAPILSRAWGGHWNYDVLDFSLMRNSHFPSGAMLAAMRHALPELVTSYGSSQEVLNEKLGYLLQCDPAHLQVLHGASQAFPILGRLFGDLPVLIPAPTFGEYPRTFPNATHYGDTPGTNDALQALVRDAHASRICVIVNPNTPTGTLIPTATIHALAADSPRTTFIVDESFLAFSDQPSLIGLLAAESLANVLVLTSLGKSTGAAGLRLGYVYARDPALVEAIGAALPIWNLSSPSELLLELLLKFRPEYVESLRRTVSDREGFRAQLETQPGITCVHPSSGNFVLVELRGEAEQAAALRERLLHDYMIEIKDVTAQFGDGVPRIRLAVRLPEENTRLLEALSEIWHAGAVPV